MSRTTRWVFHVLRAACGIALFIWVLSRGGDAAAFERLLATGWLLAAMLLAALVGTIVEAVRLGILFRCQGLSLSVGNGSRLVAISTLFNLFLPGGTGGDLMKLYYVASENRGRGVESATVLLVDRAVALFALLALLSVLALGNLRLISEHAALTWLAIATLSGVVAIPAAIAIAWSSTLRSSRPFIWLTTRAPLHAPIRRVTDALQTFRGHVGSLAAAAAVSATGHVSLAALFYAVGTVLMPDATPLTTAYLSLTGLVANAVPITPGGIGVGEAAFEQLFALAGHSGGAGLIVAWRLAMLPVAAAGCVLYVLGRRGKRFTQPSEGARGGVARELA